MLCLDSAEQNVFKISHKQRVFRRNFSKNISAISMLKLVPVVDQIEVEVV